MANEDSDSSDSVLDPVDRFSEMLFGLIMAMTFTGSLNMATAGAQDVHTMLVGAIGCNLAWGLVDAVMYLLTTLIQRGRNLTLVRRIRSAPSPEQAHAILAEVLPGSVMHNLASEKLGDLWQRLKRLPEPAARPHFRKDDLRAAVAIFFLVTASTFPVVVPFMVFDQATLATRVSNGTAIVLMFGSGYGLGHYAGLGPWRTGFAMVGVGFGLVAVIIALGG